MSTLDQMNRPSRPAPEGYSKESVEVVIATFGDRVFEIPLGVAEQYEAVESHDVAESEEVGGRHAMAAPGGGVTFHGNWAVGPYQWIDDGRTYSGPHWHPNANNPFAYDIDNY